MLVSSLFLLKKEYNQKEKSEKFPNFLQHKDGKTSAFHSRSLSQRLRIDYLSPDFRNHAVGRLVCQLFEHHDRTPFKVSAYMTVDMEDEITTQIQTGCDRLQLFNLRAFVRTLESTWETLWMGHKNEI